MAHSIEADLKRVPGTREVRTIGGPGRAVLVEIDPTRMAGVGVTVADLRQALQSANGGLPVGELVSGNRSVAIESGPFLREASEVADLVVGVRAGKPVFLRDVAAVRDGPLPAARYVWHGPAAKAGAAPTEHPAVTLAITKKPGENAIDVADAVMARVAALRNTVIPAAVQVAETRNYGASANDKAQKLIQKLLFATASVVALVFIALGRREAAIVGSAVILTLTVTLFASWAWGFTLNRVSLFALIFSIGILVDDAIVVVENIHRHQALHPGRSLSEIIPGAVDEVGGPTILATLTVIAALLPMAFVSGLMGPYMSPIPINASMGMLLSLAIAFVVTPWLARLWMKATPAHHADDKPHGLAARIAPAFARVFRPLLDAQRGARHRGLLGLGIAALIAVSLALPATGLVLLKMLPFDNKSEFQVIVDMPAGTPVEQTAAVLQALGRHLATVPEVTDYQAYAGTAAPINFNGLVRQYDLRSGGNVGDLQVNLVDKHQRSAQSHAIATRVRPALQQIGQRFGANVKVVEVPPGPPVLSPIVAEIYGPEADGRRQVAQAVRQVFEKTPGIVDVDDSGIADAPKTLLLVDRQKAAMLGVPQQAIVATLRAGLAGEAAAWLHDGAKYPAAATLMLPPEAQGDLNALLQLAVRSADGQLVPIRELVTVKRHAARATHLPQEPAAGALRGGRHGRCGGQPAVRHVPDARPDCQDRHPWRRHAGRGLHPPARRRVPRLHAEVGRRIADHLRDLPRHGRRLCGGPGADLPAGGGAVRQLPDAADHHGADPADHHRRDARPRPARRALHRHQHDRHDRAGRHHRAQLHPAGGLHQPAGAHRHGAGNRHRAGRRHPGAAHRADRAGRDAGRVLHPRRPDLQRPGDLADLRHLGVDRADPGGHPDPVLRGLPPPAGRHHRPGRSRSAPHPRRRTLMTSWQIVRLIAGSFILLSLALGIPGSPLFVSAWWLAFTAFVGANLLQSALTRWCLMETILRKLGVRAGA